MEYGDDLSFVTLWKTDLPQKSRHKSWCNGYSSIAKLPQGQIATKLSSLSATGKA
jgi:hypothetical protein